MSQYYYRVETVPCTEIKGRLCEHEKCFDEADYYGIPRTITEHFGSAAKTPENPYGRRASATPNPPQSFSGYNSGVDTRRGSRQDSGYDPQEDLTVYPRDRRGSRDTISSRHGESRRGSVHTAYSNNNRAGSVTSTKSGERYIGVDGQNCWIEEPGSISEDDEVDLSSQMGGVRLSDTDNTTNPELSNSKPAPARGRSTKVRSNGASLPKSMMIKNGLIDTLEGEHHLKVKIETMTTRGDKIRSVAGMRFDRMHDICTDADSHWEQIGPQIEKDLAEKGRLQESRLTDALRCVQQAAGSFYTTNIDPRKHKITIPKELLTNSENDITRELILADEDAKFAYKQSGRGYFVESMMQNVQKDLAARIDNGEIDQSKKKEVEDSIRSQLTVSYRRFKENYVPSRNEGTEQ